jgi:hypothetical protein
MQHTVHLTAVIRQVTIFIVDLAGWFSAPVWRGTGNLAQRIRSQDRPSLTESLFHLRYNGPKQISRLCLKYIIFSVTALTVYACVPHRNHLMTNDNIA